MSRRICACCFAAALPMALMAQSLTPATAVQHVTAAVGASAATVAPGGVITLWADVTPKPNIHVYAPGAKDFSPVALIVSTQPSVRFGKAQYPAGVPTAFPGLDQRVPVYQRTFRITQPLTVAKAARAGQTLTIAGAINYQACDDHVCFPPASLPITWTLNVK